MRVHEFDFELPAGLIAQEPAVDRTAARLLCLSRQDGSIEHRHVADLPDRLRAGDVLVVNNTRVFPARLLGHRVPSGGAVECLLVTRLESTAEGERWEALMHPGQKLKPGARVQFEGPPGAQRGAVIHGEVEDRRFFGRRVVRLWTEDGTAFAQAVDRIGHVPLPPYIHRDDEARDRERYQTMFAAARGSIAAPTAGLHFTEDLAARLRTRGVTIAEITLHVGYGTFQPVRVEDVEAHRIEPERFEISEASAAVINTALDEGRRVIAVGTTTTRTLEASAEANGGRVMPGSGETGLFIYPGFPFRVISGLLTNFHLPRSSLLMLVSALGGRDRVLEAYRQAVASGYRFYSYGDAMLLL